MLSWWFQWIFKRVFRRIPLNYCFKRHYLYKELHHENINLNLPEAKLIFDNNMLLKNIPVKISPAKDIVCHKIMTIYLSTTIFLDYFLPSFHPKISGISTYFASKIINWFSSTTSYQSYSTSTKLTADFTHK